MKHCIFGTCARDGRNRQAIISTRYLDQFWIERKFVRRNLHHTNFAWNLWCERECTVHTQTHTVHKYLLESNVMRLNCKRQHRNTHIEKATNNFVYMNWNFLSQIQHLTYVPTTYRCRSCRDIIVQIFG